MSVVLLQLINPVFNLSLPEVINIYIPSLPAIALPF